MDTDPRQTLDRLIRERREDYASISRLLGRNAAYVQQFIKRGSPRKLDEEDRRTLARYFGVSEAELGGPSASDGEERLTVVPVLAVAASAGGGAFAEHERVEAAMRFDPAWLRRLRLDPTHLSVIRVTGDSMAPTLDDGDDILVDCGDGLDRLRDGIYVLRLDGALNVKRLLLDPSRRRVTVKSDNPAYRNWPVLDRAGVDVVGRVVWAGRRFS
jgi:phage repressor protein C with HTH and peptisase S24 domain